MASGHYSDFGYTSYQRPDATAYLSGPGTYATVGGAYAQSYAAETDRGGIYVDNTTYYGSRFSSVSSYHYAGAYYSYSSHDDYSNYTIQTHGSPAGGGYRYGPALPYGYGHLDVLDLYGSSVVTYSGSTAYHGSFSASIEEFSSGYTLTRSSYSSYASEGGQVVPGSQHTYSSYTSTNPDGAVTYLSPDQLAPAFYGSYYAYYGQ